MNLFIVKRWNIKFTHNFLLTAKYRALTSASMARINVIQIKILFTFYIQIRNYYMKKKT